LVAALVNEEQPAGEYQILWQGQNQESKAVSSGIYFYELHLVTQNGSYKQARKLLLVR